MLPRFPVPRFPLPSFTRPIWRLVLPRWRLHRTCHLYYVSTDPRVDSSSCFLFRARTHTRTHRQTVTDSTHQHTHADAGNSH